MSAYRDWSFERKLRFAILFTTVVSMVLACGLFLAQQYFGYQRSLMRTVTTLARVTADNSTAAIAFNDPVRARETLNALRADSQIVAAVLLRTDGSVVASYVDRPERELPAIEPLTYGAHPHARGVVGVVPVIQGSKWLGTLHVWASLDLVYQRMRFFALIVAAVLALTTLFAWILASVLRRTLARPILELANTAAAISAGQDFSLRARKFGGDELGRLTEAFNTMLERTQTAVAALRDAEQQLRVVTDNAPVFLARCDCHYVFRFVNRPYAERFGLTPEQVIGRTVADLLGKEAFESIRAYMDTALRGEQVEYETEINYATLGPRWMHVVYMPERGTRGEVLGFVGVISDISQRKQIEREVARARDEALAASRAKDDFLAALSHELRTPLSPVLLTASEAAQDTSLPPEVRQDFDTIRKHVELEARLIDDLLDLTRITRGKLSLERRRIDLHAVLRDAIQTIQRELEEKRIEFVVRLEAPQSVVIGDAVRVQQVFWNVLKNAVKFTGPGGRVTVQTAVSADDERFVLEVVDTGIGMTTAELERIFDAFSQGDHVNEEGGSHRFGGLGLGLAISRMVVELHDGTIRATSEGRDRGAKFIVEFPLATADLAVEEPAAAGSGTANGAAARQPSVMLSPARILLVEDHAPTRTVLERLLVRRQFQVVAAGSLAAARALAEKENFDLLISDIGLPDGSGYDLMHELSEQQNLRGIALTGYGMEQDLARTKEAGFCAHLTKPVRVQALDAALAELFAR